MAALHAPVPDYLAPPPARSIPLLDPLALTGRP